MLFTAPLWLALLVPWAALAALLWRRTDEERATTASFLWKAEPSQVRTDRRLRRRPATWIVAALLAILLVIIALGDPSIKGRKVRLSVVIDGSVALSEMSEGRTLRDALIDGVQREMAAANVDAELSIRVAGPAKKDVRDLSEAKAAQSTARPTADAMASLVHAALDEGNVTVAITDQALGSVDSRLIVRAPGRQRDDVGIVSAVGIETPKPSVMVRIANASDRNEATLIVASGNAVTKKLVSLPPRGEAANVFIDLPPGVGDGVEISLSDLHDAFPLDDRATLLRTHGRPRLVVDAGAPPIASRFVAAYERTRRGESSTEAAVLLSASSMKEATGNEIVLPDAWPIAIIGPVTASGHPLLRDIDLDSPSVNHVAALPDGEWTILARRGDVPLIAVRESSPRAVWFGFELDPESLRSVVLLNNAVEWLADASLAQWQGQPPAAIGADWKPLTLLDPMLDASPGRYLDASSRAVAVNLPAIVGPRGKSRGDLIASLREAARDERRSLRPWIALLVACTTVAAALFALAGVLRTRTPLRRVLD